MQSVSPRRWIWVGILLLCLVGVWISWQLTQKHVASGFGADSLLGRMCEDGTASCDEVIRSRWGTVLGVPTAVWGMIYFTGAGLWCLLTGLPDRSGRFWYLLTVFGCSIGLGVAAALDYNMFVTLPQWCPLCFVTHVLSLLLWGGVLLLWPRAGRSDVTQAAAPPNSHGLRAGLALVAIGIAAVGLHENFQHRRYRAEAKEALRLFEASEMSHPAGSQPAGDCAEVRRELAACREQAGKKGAVLQELIQKNENQEVKPAALRVADPRKGREDADNLVVVFSDFECPMCLQFARYWREKIEPYALDRMQIVYRHYPMNTKCNRGVTQTLHDQSCQAAYAAEAARLQGGNDAFWKMHDQLFENQMRLGKAKLTYRQMAEACGLDSARLEADMNSEKVRERITADVRLGQQAGIRGTPVIFLNGRQMLNPANDRLWQHYLNFRKPTSAPATAPAPPPSRGP